MAKKQKKEFRLKVPLDASRIEGFKPEQQVKVVARDRGGNCDSQTVKLDEKGRGAATLTFDDNPGSLKVFVGPAEASNEEMTALQTIQLNLSARQIRDKAEFSLPPVVIRDYYWFWWLRWCRNFTVRGRVVCPDGSPVPGAKVSAFDVDCWWFWCSNQLVGSATTDASGAFEIKFRWYCGWRPWWWLKIRDFQLEQSLVDRILPVLQQDPTLPPVPDPGPKLDLNIFQSLLSEDGVQTGPANEVNAADLSGLRDRLVNRLPKAPELEHLKIWPWRPWHPWWDCTPDIKFQVTQDCEGQNKVIVDESYSDARWNIPTSLDVTLVANDEACCVRDQNDPDGNCIVIDSACDDLVASIGGNPPTAPGAALVTDGFRHPGIAATWGDRPYAGNIPISGRFGTGANVDYYEFEWSDDDGLSWNTMPTAAAGNIRRWYWGAKLGTADPSAWHPVDFAFSNISGQYVIESRQHFEANNEPASWGVTRFWLSTTMDRLMVWKTAGIFADDRYRLRVKSWRIDDDNQLDNPEILPLCDTEYDNGIVLTIDNRVVTSGPTDINGHDCGSGFIHTCTSEPDTEIVAVKILRSDGSEVDVAACDNVQVTSSDRLVIDFAANDPDQHLAYYTLRAHFGDGEVKNLLSLGTLSPGAPLPWAAPAAQVGPNYALARSVQGASAPVWRGGSLRLTINHATLAFPKTCCYLLRLRAFKRTIANCSDNYPHRNRSEYSFTVIV